MSYADVEADARFARWPTPQEVAAALEERGWQEAPEDCSLVWIVEDDDWRLRPADAPLRRCRQPRCDAPAVAELARKTRLSNARGGGTVKRWWAYCADHLYGRVIEDGKILVLVLREVRP